MLPAAAPQRAHVVGVGPEVQDERSGMSNCGEACAKLRPPVLEGGVGGNSDDHEAEDGDLGAGGVVQCPLADPAVEAPTAS